MVRKWAAFALAWSVRWQSGILSRGRRKGYEVTIDKEQLFSRAFNARGGYLLVAVAMWWRR